MMANCLESRLSAARLHSAGISLRLVRSPVAPKITITQGAAIGFSWTWLMIDRPFLGQGAFQFAALRRSRFLFRVAAELEAHGRQNLGGKVAFASRQESLVERFGEHGSRRARLDAGENGPAAFARIGDAAGETLESRLLEQGNGSEIKQPGCDNAAAPPDFGYVGEIEIVLVVFGIAQRRGFGVGFMMLLAHVCMLENIQAFRVSRHQSILDPVVHHFNEVARARRAAVEIAFFRSARGLLAPWSTRRITAPRSQRVENGIKVANGVIFAANHLAVAALQAPHAAAGANINIVNALCRKLLGAANIIDVIGVATI